MIIENNNDSFAQILPERIENILSYIANQSHGYDGYHFRSCHGTFIRPSYTYYKHYFYQYLKSFWADFSVVFTSTLDKPEAKTFIQQQNNHQTSIATFLTSRLSSPLCNDKRSHYDYPNP